MWDQKYLGDSITATVNKQVLGSSWALRYRKDFGTVLPRVAHIPKGKTHIQLGAGWAQGRKYSEAVVKLKLVQC